MVDVYVRCIREGLITIDNVPGHWRADVEEDLKRSEKA